MKYFLVAGEASGDLHASRLMRQLKVQDTDAQFRYFGGDAMRAEGGVLLRHYRDLAFMGFVQVIRHLPQILTGMSQCRREIADFQPDAVILIDYPGFNLSMAKWVKRNLPGAKVCYYISPKIWAWKSYRIRQIRRYVDVLMSILPFEVEWFAQRGYQVHYVGNPTVDELASIVAQPFDREAFCTRHGINSNQSIIALLPGSRKAEVESNLPLMLEAATTISCHQLIVAGAPGFDAAFYDDIIRTHQMVPRVKVVFGETYDILRAAEVAAVTSGTATLETAYLRCPQVVCYHLGGGKFFYHIMKFLLRHIRYVSLVNLLLDGVTPQSAGKATSGNGLDAPAVPELLSIHLTASNLHQHLIQLCGQSAARVHMLSAYDRMIEVLGQPGAPERAAALVIKSLGRG